MNKSLLSSLLAVFAISSAINLNAQQLPDPGFESWNGGSFDGKTQATYWHGSNVSQFGKKMQCSEQGTGHTGSYSMYVHNSNAVFGNVSPGYVSLGTPWAYIKDITEISGATAGTYGGISFTYRPDAMKVWIKRVGSKATSENFNIVFYSWKGTAKGASYKSKGYGCTTPGSPYNTDEESDIRLALNKNMCSTTTAGTQIGEGWIKEKKAYSSWTQLTIPIYYLNSEVPEKTNVIFSAGNYPNFRDNDGIYEGNGLYIDDVELIYYSNIEKLFVNGEQWTGFRDAEDLQTYTLPEGTTALPSIYGMRGAGVMTNDPPTHGKFEADYSAMKATVNFPGRRLSDSELTVSGGKLNTEPVTITVRAQDGSSTHTYKILFKTAPSTNSRLAGIEVNGESMSTFNASVFSYEYGLPFGTTTAPVLTVTKGHSAQTVTITQASSVSGTATIKVVAEDGKATSTYTIKFYVRELDDITLKDILVNGKSLTGFRPTKRSYTVNIPTETVPTITPMSAYAAGLQTISVDKNTLADGCVITVKAPATTEVGTYTLKYKVSASEYAYLADIKVGGTTVAGFDPEVLTYDLTLPLGTTTLPAITWTAGDEYQTIEKEEGGVDGTTRLTITAGDKTTKVIYKLNFSTEKSTNNALSGIAIDGKPLDGFSPDVLKYNIILAEGVTALPTVTYTEGDEYQTVTVTPNATTYLVRILVRAGDGSTRTYELQFALNLAKDPTLQSISIDGVLLEGFSPEKDEYTVVLPKGTTTLPPVTYEQRDYQTITVRSAGVNGDYKITVRAQSGDAMTYVIHFSVEKSSNTQLAGITFRGADQTDFYFDPEQLEYFITMPEGVSQIPAVSFTKAEDSQKVLSQRQDTTISLRVTAENGDQQTYSLHFRLQLSQETKLKSISLDGVLLEGFNPEKTEYTYYLTSDQCPVITYETESDQQQVSVITPVGAGTVRIMVSSSGASQTYTINLIAPEKKGLLLTNLLIDGVQVAGFDKSKFEYEGITYQTALPVVTWEVDAENRPDTVVLVQGRDSALVVVSLAEDKQTYTLRYSQQKDNNCNLHSLTLVDAAGLELAPQFDAATTAYSVAIPAGGTVPQVTYELSQPALQSAVAGFTTATQYQVKVSAQNGDSKTYTVDFNIAPYTSVVPAVLDTFTLVEGTNTYDVSTDLAKGQELPELNITAAEGQMTAVVNSSNLSQQVFVVAESGDTASYYINYHETTETNALLNDIRVLTTTSKGQQWQSIDDFDTNTTEYTVELPQGTRVVPCIYPISNVPEQEITITYGAVDSKTQIHVVSGEKENDYYIQFNVLKSANTKLRSLSLISTYFEGEEEDVEKTKSLNVDNLSFDVHLRYGTLARPTIQFRKDEPEQTVQIEDNPIAKATIITVTAENGDKRQYTINYTVVEPEGENILKKISYKYKDKDGTEHTGEIANPEVGEHIIDLPYGAKSFEVTEVKKNYDEQAVLLFNNGLRYGATLIVSSNQTGVDDITYTLVPRQPKFDTTGKLQSLTFNGKEIDNFDPCVFNYIVKVTTEPKAANFVGTGYDGKTYTGSALDTKKKQITLSTGGATYLVYYFYENDGKYAKGGKYYDWFDFSQNWVATDNATFYTCSLFKDVSATSNKYSKGFKPYGWVVPADCTSGLEFTVTIATKDYVDLVWYSGKEVLQAGQNGAMLSTQRGASTNSSLPGMMTLGGTMSVNPDKNGNTSSSLTYSQSNYKQLRNTPDSIAMEYKTISNENISNWYFELKMSDGSAQTDTKYSGNYSSNGVWKHAAKAISYPSGNMSKFAFSINSANTVKASDMGGSAKESGTMYTSDLQVEDIHFVYNSHISGTVIDTYSAASDTKDPYIYVYNLTSGTEEYNHIPALSFTKQVHDQMQVVEWLYDGEWKYGEKVARVTNYGENLEDNTVYTVRLYREPVIDLTLDFEAKDEEGVAYPTKTVGDTTIIYLPFGTRSLPDLTIKRHSIHQKVTLEKSGWIVKATVENEAGDKKVLYYKFREQTNANAALNSLNGEGLTYDSNTLTYELDATAMPQLTYAAADDGQTIKATFAATAADIHVVSSDKTAENTYTVALRADDTVDNTLSTITANLAEIDGFDANTFDYTDREDLQNYAVLKAQPAAQLVQTLSAQSVTWTIGTGEDAKTYTYTLSDAESGNAQLAGITNNGTPLDDFSADKTDYTLNTNDPVNLVFEPGDNVQQIQIRLRSVSAPSTAPARKAAPSKAAAQSTGVIFEAIVTAEDMTENTYSVTILPELSHANTLQMIYVNGVELAGFLPEKHDYDYTIALSDPKAAKTVQPNLPSVRWKAADETETITVNNAEDFGEATTISVRPDDGTAPVDYTVSLIAEASHYAQLSGIAINGKDIDFESTRNYYSVYVEQGEPMNIAYSSLDNFQTIAEQDLKNKRGETIGKQLVVTAEDGINEMIYSFERIDLLKSSNTTLANITLNGGSFKEFDSTADDFTPDNRIYHLPLKGETPVPNVSAVLSESTQTYEISNEDDGYTKRIIVTAEDGSVSNYLLMFDQRKNDNARLQGILVDGNSIAEVFDPENNIWNYDIFVGKVGEEQLPSEIVGDPEDWEATVDIPVVSENTTILVTAADDKTQKTYFLNFRYTYSDADTLMAIYTDDGNIEGFRPDSMYYHIQVEAGKQMPVLGYDQADEYQTIQTAVQQKGLTTTTQYIVTAGSGKRNVYTVVVEQLQSHNADLSNILIADTPLEGFSPDKTSYSVVLPLGTTAIPTVTADKGDELQNEPEVRYGEIEDYTYITAYAQDGTQKIYSIRFTEALSDNPYIAGINISSEPLRGFQSEVLDYMNISLPYGTTAMPLITFQKAEAAQTVTIDADPITWQARVTSVAANGQDSAIYNLAFKILRSDADTLRMIYLNGESLREFRADDFEYEISLPYGSTNIPDITWTIGNEQQTVTAVLPDTLQPAPWDALIKVVSGSEDYENTYRLRFTVEGCPNSLLDDIMLAEESIIDQFVMDTASGNFVYTLRYAAHTPIADFYKPADITYTLGEEHQLVQVVDTTLGVYFEVADTIIDVRYTSLLVTAEDGSMSVYQLEQYAGLSGNALLRELNVNGESVRNFVDTVFEYTYFVFDGVQTFDIEAVPADDEAEILPINYQPVGDTTLVRCQAADGTRQVYRIIVRTSDIQTAQTPTSADVVLKHVGGTRQFIALSLRDNVNFALYDSEGNRIYSMSVHPINPNSAQIATDALSQDILLTGDDYANGAVFELPTDDQPYFYVFTFGKGKKIKSGKIMITK